jgi:3-oxoacyl-[acyl-carrier protein] reductase
MSQRGRVALVTGGTRGIGRATVLQLAREGADIVVNYSRDDVAAQSVLDEAVAFGIRALRVKADIGDLTGVQHLVREAQREFGRVDLLVCNAGAGGRITLIPDTTDEDWQRMIDVNARLGNFCLRCCGASLDVL